MPNPPRPASGDRVIGAAEDGVRASLEAAAKIARKSVDASAEAARKDEHDLTAGPWARSVGSRRSAFDNVVSSL